MLAEDAIIAAAELSDRYITARFLPDKAIDTALLIKNSSRKSVRILTLRSSTKNSEVIYESSGN